MPSTFLVTSDSEFEAATRAELARQDSKLAQGEAIVPGIFLIHSSQSAEEFAGALALERPIYARHMFPVQTTVSLTRTADDLEKMADAVSILQRLPQIRPETPFAVQARLLGKHEGESAAYPYRSFAIKDCLAAIVLERSRAVENIRDPKEILSVVCVGETSNVGLSPAELNLSSWAGGKRRLARRPEQISRAELKLEEALEVFNFQLPTDGEALDLGAAPGGWARVMLEAGLRVTAVDPANLSSRLQLYGSRLTHCRVHAGRVPEKGAAREAPFCDDYLRHANGCHTRSAHPN